MERPDPARIAFLEHDLGYHDGAPEVRCERCNPPWMPWSITLSDLGASLRALTTAGAPDPVGEMGKVAVATGGRPVMTKACPDCSSTVWHLPHPGRERPPLPPPPNPDRSTR